MLHKPLHQLDSATAAFGRDTGVFVTNAYRLPGDDFEGGLQLPYGTEVMGCRCDLLALQPQSPLLALLPLAARLTRLEVSWCTNRGDAWCEGKVVDYYRRLLL